MRVLVVGGGIGGLSATIAMRRAGFDVDLIEKNPAWDVYGVGIIQPGNALRALNELGLAEACVAQGHPINGDAAWLGDGEVQLADNDWPALVPGLPPGNGITRPRLHKILQSAALESSANVRTGVSVTSLDDAKGEYDLVVGADGLHSQIRETLFPDVRPKLTGQVCWRYNLPRIEGLDKIWVYIGPRGTAGFVPLADDLMYMLTIEKPPEDAPLRLPREGLAATYRERLAGFGGPVAAMRELVVDDEAVVYRPVENLVVPAPWYRDNVVLIGDAAHATSPHCGQGAAQAVEDALVLTQELSARDDVGSALDAFMERRFDRCRFIVEGSEAIGAWEMDHSLPIDPNAKRQEVVMAAMAPL